MKIQYFSEIGIETLKQQLSLHDHDDKVSGILLLACDANNYTQHEINPILQSVNKPLFGGVVPSCSCLFSFVRIESLLCQISSYVQQIYSFFNPK